MIIEKIYDWLDTALYYGVNELDFWNMTLAEIERVIKSQQRKDEDLRRERAYFDYIHANLIGRSVGRLRSSSIMMPSLSEVYPNLFNTPEEQERQQKVREDLSVLRFKEFTQSFNKRFKEVGKSK